MHISLDNSTGCELNLILVKNVSNLKEIKANISNIDCACIKPCLIVDPQQVIFAANKAALSRKNGKLITKTINSEILYNLSVSKKISQSLTQFGIGKDYDHVLVAVVAKPSEDKGIKELFKGDFCEISELSSLIDIEQIKTVYKIKDNELKVSSLLDSVLTRIATKDFVSY